jgi:hypothetical protein
MPALAIALALGGLVLVACNPAPSATAGAPSQGKSQIASPGLSSMESPGSGATPVSTVTSGAPPCDLADLKASHGLVEGAAGSRLTTVVLVSAVACSIDAFPALGLRDAQGTILVGAAAGGSGRIDLVTGNPYETNVRLANWCASEPAFPLALEIVLGREAVPVTGSSFPDDGELPPCNGDGGPILEASQWVAAP